MIWTIAIMQRKISLKDRKRGENENPRRASTMENSDPIANSVGGTHSGTCRKTQGLVGLARVMDSGRAKYTALSSSAIKSIDLQRETVPVAREARSDVGDRVEDLSER